MEDELSVSTKGKRPRWQTSFAAGDFCDFPVADDEDIAASCLILLARGGKVADAGIYVYECKTCSRTFPSFQALGGHRAGHKKPKSVAHQKNCSPAADHGHHEELVQKVAVSSGKNTTPPFLAVESHKLRHECSVCGSEFSSGQALGGHMRRHKSGNSTKTDASTTVLTLDLNLPAPPEDGDFRQFPPASLVFSAAPALVDCHY